LNFVVAFASDNGHFLCLRQTLKMWLTIRTTDLMFLQLRSLESRLRLLDPIQVEAIFESSRHNENFTLVKAGKYI
jgi:hypothetical protein